MALLIQSPVYYGHNVPVATRDYAKTNKWIGTMLYADERPFLFKKL
ncbi:hypothetical protein [Kordia sp.]